MKIPTSPESGQPVLDAPRIADPVVERLVEEARQARVRDDIRSAILKLEDAEAKAPEDPTVLYLSAEVFEAMGHYERAADYYEKVYTIGAAAAGSLHELAAHKLSHGFEQARRMEGQLTLGQGLGARTPSSGIRWRGFQFRLLPLGTTEFTPKKATFTAPSRMS